MLDHEQLSMIPPDRVHLQFDVWAVGPTGRIALTYALQEGTTATLEALETTGFELGDAGVLWSAHWIAERIEAALARLSPF